ncbi:uncharacterized protein LOC136767992 [Amia ocellicauda]|uniref:uncharacterized protein LOC136767992 n=1 Tax=Amia ocellicauda TaxID=2972642 RepID=UPI00346416BD
MMPLIQRLLCLTLLLLPLSGGRILQPPPPRPCARLLPPEPQSPLPGGGGGQEHRLGQAGAPLSFAVAPGCELTLWGGQASRSFASGKHLNVSLGLEGGPTAFHCSCLEQQGPRETPSEKFVRQHVDPDSKPPFDDKYCNDRISKYSIWKYENNSKQCKPTNMFIHARVQQVTAVCRGSGNYTSNTTFRKTVCKLQKGDPICLYSAREINYRISLTCDNNRKPVHLIN